MLHYFQLIKTKSKVYKKTKQLLPFRCLVVAEFPSINNKQQLSCVLLSGSNK